MWFDDESVPFEASVEIAIDPAPQIYKRFPFMTMRRYLRGSFSPSTE
jgi:hypothetical protein